MDAARHRGAYAAAGASTGSRTAGHQSAPAPPLLGASSVAEYEARLSALAGRRPAGSTWRDLGNTTASRPGSVSLTTAQLWVQLPPGTAAREALLPTLGSRIRQRHRPWANPMWTVAFVTAFVVYIIVCTMLLVQAETSEEVCNVHISVNETAIAKEILSSYQEVFVGHSSRTVWFTVFLSLALGIIWIGSLTTCAKAGLYGTIIVSFVLQAGLTVAYFTLGSKTLKLADGVPSLVIAVIIFVAGCVLQQKIHIAAKTVSEAAVLINKHWGMLIPTLGCLVFNVALLMFTLYTLVRSFDVRTGSCDMPGAWVWIARAYVLLSSYWAHQVVNWARGVFIAGTVAMAYFYETRGASPVKYPVLTALKWAFGRSLGASAVAAMFSSFAASCTTCCYCCYCCFGACSPSAGQHELDGIKIKWRHDKPTKWYTVEPMVQLDWTRTVQGLPGMIQAYVAVTGHDFVTAACHVHSMLMCQDMWLWCAYIYRLCRALAVMLTFALLCLSGSLGFAVGFSQSNGTDLGGRIVDGIALTSVTATITTVITIYYTRLLVISVGTVLMCFVLDKTHEGASAAARNQSRQEYSGGGGKGGKGKGKYGSGSTRSGRRPSRARHDNWATEPLLKHLTGAEDGFDGFKWSQTGYRVAHAAPGGRATVETGTVVANASGGEGGPAPSTQPRNANGGAATGSAATPGADITNGTNGDAGSAVSRQRPPATSMEIDVSVLDGDSSPSP